MHFANSIVSVLGHLRDEQMCTVIILNIGTDRSEQTVETQIRLLLMEQSDQGLLCYSVCIFWTQYCTVKSNCSNCRTIMVIISGVPIFRIFTVLQYLPCSHGTSHTFWKHPLVTSTGPRFLALLLSHEEQSDTCPQYRATSLTLHGPHLQGRSGKHSWKKKLGKVSMRHESRFLQK